MKTFAKLSFKKFEMNGEMMHWNGINSDQNNETAHSDIQDSVRSANQDHQNSAFVLMPAHIAVPDPGMFSHCLENAQTNSSESVSDQNISFTSRTISDQDGSTEGSSQNSYVTQNTSLTQDAQLFGEVLLLQHHPGSSADIEPPNIHYTYAETPVVFSLNPHQVMQVPLSSAANEEKTRNLLYLPSDINLTQNLNQDITNNLNISTGQPHCMLSGYYLNHFPNANYVIIGNENDTGQNHLQYLEGSENLEHSQTSCTTTEILESSQATIRERNCSPDLTAANSQISANNESIALGSLCRPEQSLAVEPIHSHQYTEEVANVDGNRKSNPEKGTQTMSPRSLPSPKGCVLQTTDCDSTVFQDQFKAFRNSLITPGNSELNDSAVVSCVPEYSSDSHACNWCGKSFRHRQLLIRHVRVHTSEKPFNCRWCDKRFSQATNCIRHEQIHKGEKPFVCDDCGKRFSLPFNLKRHKMLHTRQSPCPYCDKCCQNPSALTIHLRSHTGERPFKRDKCEKAFVNKSNKNQRILTHKKGKRNK